MNDYYEYDYDDDWDLRPRSYNEEPDDPVWFTIEPSSDGDGVVVYKHDTYPASSVLAGRDRRTYLKWYEDAEAALAEHPDADVKEWSTKVDIPLSDVAPDWFDPLDAGEEW